MYQSRRPRYRTPGRPAAPAPSSFKILGRNGIALSIAALLTAAALFVFFSTHHRGNKPAGSNTQQQSAAAGSFDKNEYSTTDPASIWVIVNKPLPLKPIDYAPADLTVPDVPLRVPGNESMQVREATARALEKLVVGAKTAGFDLMLGSGYRSYTYQVNLYNGYVQSSGQAEADKTSARPGHSEHQTGLAADVEPVNRQCELDACFGDLPAGKWLAANAYKYGFIIRYPADKVAVTGYDYEPWHLRYVGDGLAAEMHKQGVTTLEEFFNAKGGKDFN